MSMSLASATINELASSTVDTLAESVLTVSSEDSGGDRSSTSCPWSSSTVTSLIQAIADLTEKVDDLADELAKVTARIPSSGTGTLVTMDDVSTFANAVWTSSVTDVGRTLTDAISITSGSAAAIAGNMNTSAIGAAITGVTATVNESELATQLLAGDNNLATKLGTSLSSNSSFTTAVGQNINASNIAVNESSLATALTNTDTFATTVGQNINASSISVTVPTPTVQWSTSDKTDLINAILDTTAGSHTTTGTIGAKISATGDGGTVDTTSIAEAVWTYGDGTTTTRSLTSSTTVNLSSVTEALNALQTSVDAIPTTTYTIPTDYAKSSDISGIAEAVWTYGDSDTVRVNHRKLTSNSLPDNKALALSSEINVTLDADGLELTIPTASDIAQEVWTTTASARSLTVVSNISQDVWNYGQDTKTLASRSISTPLLIQADGTSTNNIAYLGKTLGAVDSAVWGNSSAITNSSIATAVRDNFDSADIISEAVWNYGNNADVSINTKRSLSTPKIYGATGESEYNVGYLSNTRGTIDQAVWNYGQEEADAIESPSEVTVSLTENDKEDVAKSVISYDITNLDSNTTKYNLDNAIRTQLLNSVSNNHNSSGDTLTTLKTDGVTSKAVFNKTTNKRGEMEKIK